MNVLLRLGVSTISESSDPDILIAYSHLRWDSMINSSCSSCRRDYFWAVHITAGCRVCGGNILLRNELFAAGARFLRTPPPPDLISVRNLQWRSGERLNPEKQTDERGDDEDDGLLFVCNNLKVSASDRCSEGSQNKMCLLWFLYFS